VNSGTTVAANGVAAGQARPLGWLGIIRLGLVQMALGAIVVLMTSTLNRVMVVELALPATLPGALVALHFAVQMLRPRLGYGSDVGGRRTPWIVGGMAVLALGGLLAALATAWMATDRLSGVLLAIVAFLLIGGGVGASGTSLLVLLAKRVAPRRRAAAATAVWVMMICGFIVTAGAAGRLLDPFSVERLVAVTAAVCTIALCLTLLAVRGVEGPAAMTPREAATAAAKPPFGHALRQVWSEPEARRFTIFVFMSMLAYSAQDLILEPFAGAVFGFTPGESTTLSGVQHGGVLLGMLMVGALVTGAKLGTTRAWMTSGCIASALALASLAVAGVQAPEWPLRASVFALGVANGTFAVAAIGEMMALSGAGQAGREGVRMGLWGAAQAIAFGIGGFLGTVGSDLAHLLVADSGTAYAAVFAAEAVVFLLSAGLALGLRGAVRPVGPNVAAPGAAVVSNLISR
jgi:BCD family chlorophyll transporter-like MFS transporter